MRPTTPTTQKCCCACERSIYASAMSPPFRWMLGFVIAFLTSFDTHGAASNTVSNVDSNRLAWNKQTLVDAYYKVGRTNSAWDETAKSALSAYALIRSMKSPNLKELAETVAAPCRAAKAARCTDPLVQYLYVRYVSYYADIDQAEYADALGKAADGLASSRYPPIRKLYGSVRAAEEFKRMGTNFSDQMYQNRFRALRQVTNIVNDSSVPIGEIDDVCNQLIDLLENNPRQLDDFYPSVEAPLFKNWPGTWQAWLIKGKFYRRHAWKARGSGLANTVSEVGWKLFGEHLETARESLEKAWSLNQTDTRIPTEMIVVELGQGKNRERMELWFERAMKLDTNNSLACQTKLQYLMPKWYGSEKEMLDFGRECVNSSQW